MREVQALDAINAPLNGNILIEASAGTGKTFTITTLLLRFLLGLNDQSETLKLENILIVTFTNAATAELKERIFKRIVELRHALSSYESGILDGIDPVLMELIGEIESGKYSIDREQAIAKLIMAEREIDQASIFTIHGFCQRVIFQYAFSANLPFGVELNKDLDDLFDHAIHQFWRQECYLFSRELTLFANQYYQSPHNIKSSIRPYISNPQLLKAEKEPIITNREALEEHFSSFFELSTQIKNVWSTESHLVEKIIQESDVNKRSYSSRNLPNWIAQVDQWAKESNALQLPENLYKFTVEALEEKTKEGGNPPEHSLFLLISKLYEVVKALDPERVLLLFAVHHILMIFDRLKEERREIGFDDILIQLSRVLEQEGNENLINLIRHNYRAVMIDEFQDTDGYQYSIFNRLFVDSSLPFIMIGDPKQSIYKFRGADIYVYLEAKANADIVYTLDTNYRSSKGVVDGVNRLFSLSKLPFIEEAIPFYSVNSAEGADNFNIKLLDQSLHGIHFIESQIDSNRATYLAIMAEQFADESVQLLEEGKLINENGARDILPEDITFLVRSGSEAQIIKDALISRGLNAVYLSERSNVFESLMAQEILLLLQSLLAPRNVRLIKRLLSSVLFGLSLEQYQLMVDREDLYEEYLKERDHLISIWNRHGVLALIRSLVMREDRLARLQSLEDGERLVTDLFHLAEILQEKQFPTHQMLVEWLEERLDDIDKDEAYHLRLESDFEAIKILTIHKSKGLEFPIVMMPFVLNYLNYRAPTPFYDHKHGQLSYHFSPDEAVKTQIMEEELAEAVRLLYVGVTRAKYHCRLGFAPNITHGRGKRPIPPASALGYLLNLSDDNCDLPDELFYDEIIDRTYFDETLIKHRHYSDERNEDRLAVAAMFDQVIDYRWRFTSFSHLSYQRNRNSFDHDGRMDEMDLAIDENDTIPVIERTESLDEIEIDPIFTFPKGANTGNMLHDLFENSMPDQLKNGDYLANALKESPLFAQCEANFEASVETLLSWFTHMLETQFSCGASLESILEGDQHINELEFLFPINSLLTPTKINGLINRHRNDEVKSTLDFEALTGMLKGFIDLTFYWEGRYYICDYKSNYLGDHLEDYKADALKEAVYRANYDWQYLIYTVALVKFLRLHDPKFSYEEDFGGVYYLFLRGMRKGSESGIYFNKPEEALIDAIEQTFSNEVEGKSHESAN